MSFVIPKSIAGQHPERETAPHASPVSDNQVLRKAAALVQQSQYGTESFGAAMREITTLLGEHRDSVVAPLLEAVLDGMQEKDATHNFKVAMFYLQKRGIKEAAELRLRHIVEKYPKYSRLDEVLYQLSLLEYETGHRAEAIQRLERLISEYELSPRKNAAESKLKRFKL